MVFGRGPGSLIAKTVPVKQGLKGIRRCLAAQALRVRPRERLFDSARLAGIERRNRRIGKPLVHTIAEWKNRHHQWGRIIQNAQFHQPERMAPNIIEVNTEAAGNGLVNAFELRPASREGILLPRRDASTAAPVPHPSQPRQWTRPHCQTFVFKSSGISRMDSLTLRGPGCRPIAERQTKKPLEGGFLSGSGRERGSEPPAPTSRNAVLTRLSYSPSLQTRLVNQTAKSLPPAARF